MTKSRPFVGCRVVVASSDHPRREQRGTIAVITQDAPGSTERGRTIYWVEFADADGRRRLPFFGSERRMLVTRYVESHELIKETL